MALYGKDCDHPSPQIRCTHAVFTPFPVVDRLNCAAFTGSTAPVGAPLGFSDTVGHTLLTVRKMNGDSQVLWRPGAGVQSVVPRGRRLAGCPSLPGALPPL